MNTYRKKSYRGKRGYSGRPHRRPADSYHQPLSTDSSKIPNTRHTLTKPDVEAVVDALLSGVLTEGRELERFESLLAKLTHSEYAIAFSSGTAAIHAALACLKLEPEDEVVTSTNNYCSVTNMITLTGAQPVLADCDPNTLTLSAESVKAVLTPNTKAIFTNNFGGHPSDLNALREICDEHNLLLLEDAGHGLGGKYRGHYVGNQADLTCFSFHPSMAITTCEGGAVTTGNRAIAQWLRQFRNQGLQRDSRFFQSEEAFPSFYEELQFLGMNYRLSELHAALGRSQLTRLDRHIERRRSIAQVYYQKLGAIEELTLPYVADWADNAFHFFPIQFLESLAGQRDDIFKHLSQAGIGVQVHYVPVHRMPFYIGKLGRPSQFPNTETYFQRAMSLPLFPDLSYKDLERITDVLIKYITKWLADAKVTVAETEAAPAHDSEPGASQEPTREETNEKIPPNPEGQEVDRVHEDVETTPISDVGEPATPKKSPAETKPKKRAPRKSSRLRKVPKKESAEKSDQTAKDGEDAKSRPTPKPRRRTKSSSTESGSKGARESKKNTKSEGAKTRQKPKTTRRPSARRPKADTSPDLSNTDE